MTYEFADRLIELRKDNGMSQEELAQRIGLSRQAVSKWERAESSPDIGNLVALAEIYGLTIDDIVKGTSAVSSEADGEVVEKAVVVEEAAEEVDDEPASEETAASQDVEAEAVVVEVDESLLTAVPEVSGEATKVEADNGSSQPAQTTQQATDAQPVDDVSKMPPPDPSQRVDWADAASWHPGTQAPPPGHPFGGHRGAPDPMTQPFPSPDPSHSANKQRKPAALMFPYPVLCVLLYLILGFAFGLWHPCWIIFLTIPFYYWIVNVVVNDPLWRARHGYLDE